MEEFKVTDLGFLQALRDEDFHYGLLTRLMEENTILRTKIAKYERLEAERLPRKEARGRKYYEKFMKTTFGS